MRWLRMLAALLLVLLAAEGAARLLEPHIPEPVTWSNPFTQAKYDQLEVVQAEGGAQILVVGSSIANANFDALAISDELETTAYNAGLPSSNMPLWNVYLREIALDRACPDLVVFGVGMRDSNDNIPGFGGYVRNYREAIGRRVATGEASLWEQFQATAERYSVFLRMRPRLRQPGNVVDWLSTGGADGWTEPNLDEAGRYLGFADDPFHYEAQLEDAEADFAEYAVGGAQVEALVRGIRAARNSGAQVLIVAMPAMETLFAQALPNGQQDFNDYEEAIAAVAERLNVPVLATDDMNDREEYFADLYHMNQFGTDEITRRLTAWISEEADLGEHSGCQG